MHWIPAFNRFFSGLKINNSKMRLAKKDRKFAECDLELHTARLKELQRGEGLFFYKRNGYPPEPLIDSYKRIIASLKKELKV